MRKSIISIFLLLLMLSVSSVCFADNASVDVKKIIEAEFTKHLVSYDADKSHFGLTDNDDAKKAVLGNGYPWWTFVQMTDGTLGERFTGYIFPIKVNGKSAGIVFATKVKSNWDILQISSDLTIEQDLEKHNVKHGVVNYQDENGKEGQRLIYDLRYGLIGLVNNNTTIPEFTSLREHKFLGLAEDGATNKTELIQKMKDYDSKSNVQNKVSGGGAPLSKESNKKMTSNVMGFLVIGVVILMVAATYLIKRRRSLHR